tara:strand:- start:598 stop:732 length:135 start_codon:yes stop_codon:yes gene_type:complete
MNSRMSQVEPKANRVYLNDFVILPPIETPKRRELKDAENKYTSI